VKILVDTNILVRTAEPGTSAFHEAHEAVAKLTSTGLEPCIVPQVLYEFWVVATRPSEQNGLGLSSAQAHADMMRLQDFFTLLRDERAVFERWQDLVLQHDVKGKGAHDARLVAAMQRHGITHLLTFNDKDFERFTGVTVRTPGGVLAGASL
jgi:predicted nucleic acid-binding protein